MKMRRMKKTKPRPARAYFVVHRALRDEERLLPNVKADVDQSEEHYRTGLLAADFEEGALEPGPTYINPDAQQPGA